MSVLDREALEQSPLADLHAIASELSIDSYRLLRRGELVDAILARQQGVDGRDGGDAKEAEAKPRRRRGRRGGGSRATGSDQGSASARGAADEPPSAPDDSSSAPDEAAAAKRERSSPSSGREGDTEGRDATPASDRSRFEALESRFPEELFSFDSTDPFLSAIESLAPIGKGSRATIVGPTRSGKSDALRRLAEALAGRDELELMLVLAGVRPEEVHEWQTGPIKPMEAISFAAPASAQDRAVYGAIDRARSVAVTGGHAVILLDTLDGLHEHAARRALATARNLVDGGSVTVIATASEPVGGETTLINLDPVRAEVERTPAIHLLSSGTLRAQLLVGEEGAAAIATARAEALRELGSPQ